MKVDDDDDGAAHQKMGTIMTAGTRGYTKICYLNANLLTN